MEWIEGIRDKTVGLDTAPLIYFIEKNQPYLKAMRPFFESVDRGGCRVVTSIVTLLEVLIHPFRSGDVALAQQYRDILLSAKNVTTVSLSQEIAETAARLRASHNIRTPDAIQLASTIEAGGSYFLTNDTRLPSLSGLEMLVLDELVGGF